MDKWDHLEQQWYEKELERLERMGKFVIENKLHAHPPEPLPDDDTDDDTEENEQESAEQEADEAVD
jgi:hypothetical protein